MLNKLQVRFLVVTFATMAVFGCQGDPYSSSYTRNRPNEADLIGKWVPDEATLKNMRDKGRYNTNKTRTSLTLYSDGSFEMVDMPDWWRDPFGKPHGVLQSDSGYWKLKEHSPGSWWEIDFDFPKWGGTTTALRRETPPFIIHFTLGDADSGDAMVFVRQSP